MGVRSPRGLGRSSARVRARITPESGNRVDRRGLVRTAAAALSILSAGTSCGLVGAYNANIPTQGLLLKDGFIDVTVGHSPEFPSGGQQVTVTVVTSGNKAELSSGAGSGDPAGSAAKDVWESFPYHLDQVSITVVGNQSARFSAAQLQATFGPRPTILESATLAGSVSQGYDEVYAVLGALVALLLVHVVRVELRHRRVHKDREQEVALAHEHYHLSANELQQWSGNAVVPQHHYGYESGHEGTHASPAPPYPAHTPGAPTPYANAGAPQLQTAPAHTPGAPAVHANAAPGPHHIPRPSTHGDPLPHVPHVETPWTGHAAPVNPPPAASERSP